jgi:alanyl-tRNA synthetase
VTGENALAWVQRLDETVSNAAAALKTSASELNVKLAQTLEQSRGLERELARLKSKFASSQGADLAAQATDIEGLKVLAISLDGADVKTLRETMDKLKDKLKSAAIVLAGVDGPRISLIAGVTADAVSKVKAGELVNFVAQQVGGKGGGRPDMAQAGGTEPARLPQALASVADWVRERV